MYGWGWAWEAGHVIWQDPTPALSEMHLWQLEEESGIINETTHKQLAHCHNHNH